MATFQRALKQGQISRPNNAKGRHLLECRLFIRTAMLFMIKNRWLVFSFDIENSWSYTENCRRTQLLNFAVKLKLYAWLDCSSAWICVVWRANRDAKLELVTLDDARTAWCLYTPMVFMLLTWNSNLTHIYQAKFARKVSMVRVAKFAIVMIVCVCVYEIIMFMTVYSVDG